MCTLVAMLGVVPDRPIVIAANRDEMYDRPARAPVAFGGGVVGGLDLRSGGSWLCIARDGRFAAVTNQREARLPTAPRSRGELVRALVACADRAAMRAYLDGVDPSQFASANLMYGDPGGVALTYLRRAGTVEHVALGGGITVLTNDRLGSPDFPKADVAAARLAPLAGRPWPAVDAALPAILGDHGLPPPERLPPARDDIPIPPELARALQALCIHTPTYGTRSSTIAAITADGTAELRWAEGPPCTTPFVDATPLFAG